MSAPKGHPRWGNPLKPKKYTPEQLWEESCKYFEWVDNNPWIKVEQGKKPPKPFIDKKGNTFLAPDLVSIPTQRPYTLQGLFIFLNISAETFDNYSKQPGYETHFEICTHIREIIYNQKFEGAAVGAFNHAIIARDLGLVDKQERKVLNPEPVKVQVYKSDIPFAGSESEITDQEKK